jgi:hypothetical protein
VFSGYFRQLAERNAILGDTSDLSMNVGSEKKKKTEIRKAMNDIISCRGV